MSAYACVCVYGHMSMCLCESVMSRQALWNVRTFHPNRIHNSRKKSEFKTVKSSKTKM